VGDSVRTNSAKRWRQRYRHRHGRLVIYSTGPRVVSPVRASRRETLPVARRVGLAAGHYCSRNRAWPAGQSPHALALKNMWPGTIPPSESTTERRFSVASSSRGHHWLSPTEFGGMGALPFGARKCLSADEAGGAEFALLQCRAEVVLATRRTKIPGSGPRVRVD